MSNWAEINGIEINAEPSFGTPAINVDQTDPLFSEPYGGADPPFDQRPVTNSGTGGLFAALTPVIAYQAGEPTGWLAASTFVGESGNWQLRSTATMGTLLPRTYHATVTLSVTNAVDVVIPVTLQVQPVSATMTFRAAVFRPNGTQQVGRPVLYTSSDPTGVLLNGLPSVLTGGLVTATARPCAADSPVTFTASAGTKTVQMTVTRYQHGRFG